MRSVITAPSFTRRWWLILVALVVVASAGLGIGAIIGRSSPEPPPPAEAAAPTGPAEVQVATRYLDLIAAGTESNLDELWAMTTSESPGAMRTAGDVLLGATERIEVVSVGEPVTVDEEGDVPLDARYDATVEVPTRISLAGREVDWPVRLVRLADRSGERRADWRVAASTLPSLGWPEPSISDIYFTPYVSQIRQVRVPSLTTYGSDAVQPLYPAVYKIQRRLDPWIASTEEEVAVLDEQETAVPLFTLHPTEEMLGQVAEQVGTELGSCATFTARCPAMELAESVGADVEGAEGWWLGVETLPEITSVGVDAEGAGEFTMSGGIARIQTPDGEQEVRFAGTGSFRLDTLRGETTVTISTVEQAS